MSSTSTNNVLGMVQIGFVKAWAACHGGNIDRGHRTPSSEILASSFCTIDDISGKAYGNRDRLMDLNGLDRCPDTDRAITLLLSAQIEPSPENLPRIASILLDFLVVIGVRCRALKLQWTCRNSQVHLRDDPSLCCLLPIWRFIWRMCLRRNHEAAL